MTVVLFGSRDAGEKVKEPLARILEELIQEGATQFFVGQEGSFDRMGAWILRNLCKKYPTVRYEMVTAYLGKGSEDFPTLYPEGLERTPARFAIDARNRWMYSHADTLVVYAPFPGNAKKWKERAIRAKKTVIDLSFL